MIGFYAQANSSEPIRIDLDGELSGTVCSIPQFHNPPFSLLMLIPRFGLQTHAGSPARKCSRSSHTRTVRTYEDVTMRSSTRSRLDLLPSSSSSSSSSNGSGPALRAPPIWTPARLLLDLKQRFIRNSRRLESRFLGFHREMPLLAS